MGGAERVNLELAHAFVAAGYKVEFLLRRARGELLEEAQQLGPIVDLKCDRVRQVPRALSRYLRARSPDALIAAMWPLTAIAPMAVALSSRRTRTLVCEHGILSGQYAGRGALHRAVMRATMSVGYRLADARVGVSPGVADDMARLSSMGRERIGVIGNPVPEPALASNESDTEVEAMWGIPRGARIITVGRLKPVKNHALLLSAFARIERPDARLMLVGTGECETKLRKLASDLAIADRVIFAGFRSDLGVFYRSANVLALSSDREGFGNVLVEALACGLPVVSTDCPSGPRFILGDGNYGILVPVGDVEAMARSIEIALEDRPDTTKLKARATDFSADKAARAYLTLLFGG